MRVPSVNLLSGSRSTQIAASASPINGEMVGEGEGAAPILTLSAPHLRVDDADLRESSWAPAGGLAYLASKRALDILLASLGLLAFWPLMALTAAIIKLTDGGLATYPHTRVGLDGREFTCHKFRSMVPGAEEMKADMGDLNHHEDDRTFKVPDDPRVTAFGRMLRTSSFDEVLQLWNVIRGDMSIVGPRPPVPSEVDQYTWFDMRRLEVKPGLTCTWQVSGRSNLPYSEQLQLDLQYIEQRNLWLDLKLIIQTIPAVIRGDGAY